VTKIGIRLALIAAVALLSAPLFAQRSEGTGDPVSAPWWSPGDDQVLAASVEYSNPHGAVGLINAAGSIDTDGHPFFEPIGSNGRACVSCHQPAGGMSLSLKLIEDRWNRTEGADPIFAAVPPTSNSNRGFSKLKCRSKNGLQLATSAGVGVRLSGGRQKIVLVM
jgi:hypothetical protein